ncbi:LysE family translocator [Planomicrobium sp. CPCC 101079]|uniref:LysE family translocator n=1 Tax=Planomicrobium sp. CPCC 101079 TaxID=2599618 RepID=UPI0011B688DB|nr:LysE family translocator [Planomicrobium sp. CPCC 101079]TWT02510.1 LysE family translocator [Planomicrobium sp. CPCC 101079]
MISELFSFIVLGFSLAIPVGALTIEMIKRGMRSGFLRSWLVGLGGMSADVVMMLLIYFGITNFLTGQFAQLAIWILGFIVLIYLGISSILDAFQTLEIKLGTLKKVDSLLGSYLAGFAIAISNPMSIVFWIGIYGAVLAKSLQTLSGEKVLLYSGSIFIGIAIWDIFVASSVHFSKGFVGDQFMKWFSVAAGLALILFGLSFGWRATMVLYKMVVETF